MALEIYWGLQTHCKAVTRQTATVSGQWPGKHVPAATNMHATTTELLFKMGRFLFCLC